MMAPRFRLAIRLWLSWQPQTCGGGTVGNYDGNYEWLPVWIGIIGLGRGVQILCLVN